MQAITGQTWPICAGLNSTINNVYPSRKWETEKQPGDSKGKGGKEWDYRAVWSIPQQWAVGYPDCDTAHSVRSYHWEKRKCISDKGLSESNQSFPPNLNIRVKQLQTHSQFLEESTARTKTHGHT